MPWPRLRDRGDIAEASNATAAVPQHHQQARLRRQATITEPLGAVLPLRDLTQLDSRDSGAFLVNDFAIDLWISMDIWHIAGDWM